MRPIGQLIGLAAFLGLAAASSAQTVWKWRDKDGVVHYSDQPTQGAERIELNVQTYAPPAVSSQSAKQSDKSPSAPATYSNLEIWKPSPETTIAGAGGQVSVGIRVDPGLAAGHVLNLYMDGRRLDGFPLNATEYDLTDVNRGQHTLIAVISEGKGKQVLTSKPVIFYVQRPSVLLGPKPK